MSGEHFFESACRTIGITQNPASNDEWVCFPLQSVHHHDHDDHPHPSMTCDYSTCTRQGNNRDHKKNCQRQRYRQSVHCNCNEIHPLPNFSTRRKMSISCNVPYVPMLPRQDKKVKSNTHSPFFPRRNPMDQRF